MRRILMFNRVTPDGLFATPDGPLDWAVSEPQIDARGASRMETVDTLLFGRRTYEMFAAFWPRAAASADGPHGEPRNPAHTAFATWLNTVDKVVYSRSLEAAAWGPARIERAFDPAAIAAQKRGPGKDLLILGSGSIVAQLAEHGLIDEYQLVVSPLLLGRGRALFAGLSHRAPLRLLEATAYPSGNVMLRYEPA